MPKIPFDFRKITPEIQDSPQRQESLAPYQINQQALKTGAAGKQNLTAGVSSAVASGFSAYGKHIEAQDESDMVATRAAFLRLQKEEEKALSSTSNTMEIERITEDYDKKYDDLISGNDPAFDRPNFRNQSGKDAFKNQFANNFNLKRHLSAKDRVFAMDRRNTLAGFENGIKSIPQSNYFDQPSAETETAEYVDKQVQHGFLTEEEGAEKKRIALANLDIERAARKMLDLDSAPMAVVLGSGEINPLPGQVNGYKDYVDSLKHLDDGQKAAYKKKADLILKNGIGAAKAADKERQMKIKKDQYDYETKAWIDVAQGKRELSSLFSDENISNEFKRSRLPEYVRKNEEQAKLWRKENPTPEDIKRKADYDLKHNEIANKVLRYSSSKDDGLRTKRYKLINEIVQNIPKGPIQSELLSIIDDESLPLADQERFDYYAKNLTTVFGLNEETFKVFEDEGKASISKKTGRKYVDELSELQRTKSMNNILSEYKRILRDGGKDSRERAKTYIEKATTEFEVSQDDSKLYNSYVTEKIRYE